MEEIFRCSVCKKDFTGFDAEKNCLNDEINCLGLKTIHNKVVNGAIKILKEKFQVDILEEKHDVRADSDNHGMDYSVFMYFNGKAKYKEKEFNFYTCNDYDCEGSWSFESSEALVNTFVYKYVREKEVESNEILGIVSLREHNDVDKDDYHYSTRYWIIGNQNVDDLMYDLQGKKIKIEVLE